MCVCVVVTVLFSITIAFNKVGVSFGMWRELFVWKFT